MTLKRHALQSGAGGFVGGGFKLHNQTAIDYCSLVTAVVVMVRE